MEIAIMIEGQNGLNWPRWKAIVRLVEELGFAGLYRSDHFTNANSPDKDSLELWVSLTWLADNTSRIEFGQLVSPFSFRNPAFTARMATAVDDLSNGRLTLGLGAGWQEREHHLFDFSLLDMDGRFQRMEEGLEVVTRLLKSDDPVEFSGKFYNLRGATLLPRPARYGGPPILIGGNGEKRTLPLTARYADEWNALFLLPEDFQRLNTRLDELLIAQRREPASVRRSMMTGCIFATSDADLKTKLDARGRTFEDIRQRGVVIGTSSQLQEQLSTLAQAGVQRVMLQWIDLDDLSGLEALAKTVL